VSNRGYGRVRLFVGGFLLVAAIINWGVAFTMSPHGIEGPTGAENIRHTVVLFVRNSAIGTLILATLAAWLLFPPRRPRRPRRDYAIIAILGLLVASSLYQLIWLRGLGS